MHIIGSIYNLTFPLGKIAEGKHFFERKYNIILGCGIFTFFYMSKLFKKTWNDCSFSTILYTYQSKYALKMNNLYKLQILSQKQKQIAVRLVHFLNQPSKCKENGTQKSLEKWMTCKHSTTKPQFNKQTINKKNFHNHSHNKSR